MISAATLAALSPPPLPPWEGTFICDADDVRHVKGLEYACYKNGKEIGRLHLGINTPPPTRGPDGHWGWPSEWRRSVDVPFHSGLPPRSPVPTVTMPPHFWATPWGEKTTEDVRADLHAVLDAGGTLSDVYRPKRPSWDLLDQQLTHMGRALRDEIDKFGASLPDGWMVAVRPDPQVLEAATLHTTHTLQALAPGEPSPGPEWTVYVRP